MCYNYIMNEVIEKLKTGAGKAAKKTQASLKKFHASAKKLHRRNMRRLTKWLDPRLEKYRSAPKLPAEATPLTTEVSHSADTTPSSKAPEPETPAPEKSPETPRTAADFLKILQRTPRSVLDYRARQIITMALKLPKTTAAELMTPKSKIVYVRDNEVLGPLTLDRLYRSGFAHFPVIDANEKIIGSVHTTSFNNLEIRETSRVSEILDPGVYYIRSDYNLEQVLAAFLRANCYYFLVVDSFGRIIGILTFSRFISFLFGDTITDDFDRDNDRLAVAKRKLLC